MGVRISDLPKEIRPREKALSQGLSSLSDVELLALVISKGVKGSSALDIAKALLDERGDFSSFLREEASPISIKGISSIKSLELAAVFEIARRSLTSHRKISFLSKELYLSYLPRFKGESRERLLLICYDKNKRFIIEKNLFFGNEDSLPISPRLILREAIRNNAYYFIIIHNHPSGRAFPSPGEVPLTKELQEEGSKLGIYLRDHLIIGEEEYYSFLENGLLREYGGQFA
ncbi:MAG: DNA repair protein RadC [Bacilli bacterium]|nr:DNA repair protein RadC [Bacilli bacterium]